MDMTEPTQMEFAGREALNAAFWDLGLRFQWDEATWGVLLEFDDLRAQIAYYLEHWQPHLLSVYDPAFLATLVEARLAAGLTGRTGLEAMASA
jgi:hypothetical protein